MVGVFRGFKGRISWLVARILFFLPLWPGGTSLVEKQLSVAFHGEVVPGVVEADVLGHLAEQGESVGQEARALSRRRHKNKTPPVAIGVFYRQRVGDARAAREGNSEPS